MDRNETLKELAATMSQQVMLGSEGKSAGFVQARLDKAFDTMLADAMGFKMHQRHEFMESIAAIREGFREHASA